MADIGQLEARVFAFYANVRNVMFEPGNHVRYVPRHAYGNANHPDCQDGVVKRYSDDGRTVFVLYDNKERRMLTPDEPYTAQGTDRDDLIFIARRRTP